MAGHSHWAGIKHKKALIDSKRGKLWSRLSKAIIIAAKLGGGDPDINIRLRKAIDDAKAVSMPKDNIERAIKRGTGELDGGDVEEILYEGYGPGGVAILCDIMTDNRNRTAPEIRGLFSKYQGNLGSTGCVAYLFDRKGLFILADGSDEERAMEVAMEWGGDNVETNDQGKLQITCPPEAFAALAEGLEQAGLTTEFSEVTRIAQTEVELEPDSARAALKLLEMLDDHDDVQSVNTNLKLSPELMAELSD
ncbi:MAG: YebC/PmpR family DNA-binding transcriptional regulator [Planctomycetaceae bacterium]|nr:MAG: YebC/PmpR family DNA-binding transcriptional regulator [Planctomycetaceae bacterium]